MNDRRKETGRDLERLSEYPFPVGSVMPQCLFMQGISEKVSAAQRACLMYREYPILDISVPQARGNNACAQLITVWGNGVKVVISITRRACSCGSGLSSQTRFIPTYHDADHKENNSMTAG